MGNIACSSSSRKDRYSDEESNNFSNNNNSSKNDDQVLNNSITNESSLNTNLQNDDDSDNKNRDINKPQLLKYIPSLKSSKGSQLSQSQSSYGGEKIIFRENGELNPDYKYDQNDFDNKGFATDIKREIMNKNKKPFTESFHNSLFKEKNGIKISINQYIDDKKAKTAIEKRPKNHPIIQGFNN